MNRIPSLDGLRAFSILLVLGGHLVYPTKFHSWITDAYAHAGVLIFFVISGYLITSLIRKEVERTGKLDVKKFYVRRAWRILPIAFVYLGIVTMIFHSQFSWLDIGLSWGYLASYASFFGATPWVLSHLWSLSVEEQFYLLWPITFRLKNSAGLALAAVIIAPICRMLLNHAGYYKPAFFAFPAVMDSIAVGCLMAIYEGRAEFGKWFRSARVYGWAAWPVAAGLPLLQNIGRLRFFHLPQAVGHGYWSLFNLLVAVGMLWAVSAKPWILNNPLAVWIGTLSYSIYLTQMPWTNPDWHIALWLRLAGTFTCAVISYRVIESPFLRLRYIIEVGMKEIRKQQIIQT